MWPRLERLHRRAAILGGIVACLLFAAVLAPLHDDVTRAVPALLLVVPVIGAAVIGGRIAGFVVAAAATVAFTLVLPPLGRPQLNVGEDVVALVVFVVVAFVVSALVTTKVESLQHIDDQRRALLRSASHDLRTPLSTIRAVATDLRSGTQYDERTRYELLDLVVYESDRLDRFVGNLLSMSRIEAGTLRPNMQPVDVDEWLARCTHRFEQSRHDAITLDVPRDLPFVRGDHTLLDQLLNNLLDNAARHTAAGTRVHVAARSVDRAIEITVADDGPGLPVATHALLAAGTPDASAGLGLPIVVAIVRLHDGNLTVSPRTAGTAITVSLPRAE